jgi:hypothetical protein
MGNQYAIQKLIQILNDSNEDPMVRHEAGLKIEALLLLIYRYCCFR